MLHPFVRVHIVDMNTGKYLAKEESDQPGIYNKESCNFWKMTQEGENVEKKPLKGEVNFLLPFSTKMFDMRISGVNFCEWNEEFIVNEYASNLLRENVVILFEILEFNPMLVVDNSSLLNVDKLYPVAWAYLRPLG